MACPSIPQYFCHLKLDFIILLRPYSGGDSSLYFHSYHSTHKYTPTHLSSYPLIPLVFDPQSRAPHYIDKRRPACHRPAVVRIRVQAKLYISCLWRIWSFTLRHFHIYSSYHLSISPRRYELGFKSASLNVTFLTPEMMKIQQYWCFHQYFNFDVHPAVPNLPACASSPAAGPSSACWRTVMRSPPVLVHLMRKSCFSLSLRVQLGRRDPHKLLTGKCR